MKYENPITYHSKDMATVKIFAERQTDGQAKNYLPPIFRYRGIKKVCETQNPLRVTNSIDSHAYIKVFEKYNVGQMQLGYNVTSLVTLRKRIISHEKVLSQGTVI
jgi:hypothetical protein